MSEQLASGIAQYGYLAILVLIFLQEVGIPTPIPNEFVLLFSGYLSFTGILKISLVLLSAIVGDLLASFLVFEVFYYFGKVILQRKPKWLPLPTKKIKRLSNRLKISGQSGIFIGRLTPFIKGYISVLGGLLHFSHKKYGITLVATSLIWSSAYVCCGYCIGPYWNLITQNNSDLKLILILLPASIITILLLFALFRKFVPFSK